MTSDDGSVLAWAQDTLSTFLPLLDMAFAMFYLSHITLPFDSYMLTYSLAVIDDSLNIEKSKCLCSHTRGIANRVS